MLMTAALNSNPKASLRAAAPDPIVSRLLNAVVVTYLIFVVAMMLFDGVLGPARWLP